MPAREGETTLGWEQVREWPKDAVEMFQKAGWIKAIDFAESVECPGCEESCHMPVYVFPNDAGKPMRAAVGCDQRNSVGTVKIPLARLEVIPNGSKYLRMKYRFAGKEKRLAFGVYPEIGLKDARDKRDAARKLIADGVDPSENRKGQKTRAPIGS